MKARKAIKRLQRVETLLGTVIDQYKTGTSEVHDLLDAARSSVASATQALAASPVHTPPAKAEHSGKRKLSNATRKRLSAAAKSRFRVAFDNLRFPECSALAGGVWTGDAARAWVADATLDLAASSKSCTSLVPVLYWSMTVPSNVSTRCSRLMAFLAFIYCSSAFVITQLSQSVFRRKPCGNGKESKKSH